MKLAIMKQVGLPDAPETTASASGDVLTVNGEVFDLSLVPEGGSAVAEGEGHPFVGPITRSGGVLQVPMIWTYDAANADPDQGSDVPVVEVTGGAVPDPIVRKPDLEDVE